MSQAEVITHISEWEIEFLFWFSLVFAFVYGTCYDWRVTWTGRAMLILPLGIASTLLHQILLIWHVPVRHLTPQGYEETTLGLVLTWVTLAGVGAAIIALATLLERAIHHIRSDPDPEVTRFAHRVLRAGKHDRVSKHRASKQEVKLTGW